MALELKPQDVLVLLKAVAHPAQRWANSTLGEALALSATEWHASVKRAVACGMKLRPCQLSTRPRTESIRLKPPQPPDPAAAPPGE